MINDFIYNSKKIKNIEGICEWRSPSNIALIKYWGKKPNQIPLNPSTHLRSAQDFVKVGDEVEAIKLTF
jgi:mevalonate pyrophosphate decarboxylase